MAKLEGWWRVLKSKSMQSDKILVCRCITEPGAVATALNLAKDTDELTRRELYRNRLG